MSTTAIELPLFPLSLVLFPGTIRPLHIFEPRYRQMIKDCVRYNKPFGLVLVKDGSHMMEVPHIVGTIAEIHNLHKLEDGCYNLMAVGTQRFRILDHHRDLPYLSGLVEPFDDDPLAPEQLARPVQQAQKLFMSYLHMLMESPDSTNIAESLPTDAESFSHFVACLLDMEDEQKQRYLECTSTLERLQAEIDFLRREIPFLRQMLLKVPSKEHTMLN